MLAASKKDCRMGENREDRRPNDFYVHERQKVNQFRPTTNNNFCFQLNNLFTMFKSVWTQQSGDHMNTGHRNIPSSCSINASEGRQKSSPCSVQYFQNSQTNQVDAKIQYWQRWQRNAANPKIREAETSEYFIHPQPEKKIAVGYFSA